EIRSEWTMTSRAGTKGFRTVRAGRTVGRSWRRSVAVAAFVGLLIGLPVAASAGPITLNAAVDVVGNLPASQFTGFGYGTNTYKDWGNEPYVAVNPINTSRMVISSFSYGTNSTSRGA